MNKWLPFNSVISNKVLLNSITKEIEKKPKPIKSEDEITQIENYIINAYYEKTNITITYYENGYNYTYIGKIKKIDCIRKLIYLNNFKILFNQITGVTDTK